MSGARKRDWDRAAVSVPWMNPRKPLPAWLTRPEAVDATRAQKRSRAYYLRLYQATPLWARRKDIAEIYTRAAVMRAAGFDVEVDHVIPLNGTDICGLHCPANLQIIPRLTNQKKSNGHYPGATHEQLDLFPSGQQTHLSLDEN